MKIYFQKKTKSERVYCQKACTRRIFQTEGTGPREMHEDSDRNGDAIKRVFMWTNKIVGK